MIISEDNLTRTEIADLLHAADTVWRTTVDHLARANAVAPLNVNPDGSPLTYRTATRVEKSEQWKNAEDTLTGNKNNALDPSASTAPGSSRRYHLLQYKTKRGIRR